MEPVAAAAEVLWCEADEAAACDAVAKPEVCCALQAAIRITAALRATRPPVVVIAATTRRAVSIRIPHGIVGDDGPASLATLVVTDEHAAITILALRRLPGRRPGPWERRR